VSPARSSTSRRGRSSPISARSVRCVPCVAATREPVRQSRTPKPPPSPATASRVRPLPRRPTTAVSAASPASMSARAGRPVTGSRIRMMASTPALAIAGPSTPGSAVTHLTGPRRPVSETCAGSRSLMSAHAGALGVRLFPQAAASQRVISRSGVPNRLSRCRADREAATAAGRSARPWRQRRTEAATESGSSVQKVGPFSELRPDASSSYVISEPGGDIRLGGSSPSAAVIPRAMRACICSRSGGNTLAVTHAP
jgi:hypothetical protein